MAPRHVLPYIAETAPPEIVELLADLDITEVIDFGTAASSIGDGYAALTDEGVVLISPKDELVVGITWEELASLPAAPVDAEADVVVPFPVGEEVIDLDIDGRLFANIQAVRQQYVVRQPLFGNDHSD